jgi:DNA-binding transcriptional ArsR family regulator
MLEGLFGNKVIEKILFYFVANEKCFPSELQRQLKVPLFSIQNALARLEKQGIVVSFKEGKTRIYQWNPRYPLINELKAFLEKAYAFLPDSMKEKIYEPIIRKRPRRAGKPL